MLFIDKQEGRFVSMYKYEEQNRRAMSYGMKNMEEEKKELSRAVTQITLCQN
jgi:hypothetical protein